MIHVFKSLRTTCVLGAAGLVSGCGHSASPAIEFASPPAQASPRPNQAEVQAQERSQWFPKITPLSDVDRKLMSGQRAFVEQYVHKAGREEFKTSPLHKILIIEGLLHGEIIRANETDKLQCLDVVFGDAIALHTGMVWVMVEDEFGRAPALQKPNSTVMAYPMTMISKRVQQGDNLKMRFFFDKVLLQVDEASKLEQATPKENSSP